MARWKAHVDFLLTVVELLFLSCNARKAHVDFLLTVVELFFLSCTADALQGKTCQNSRLFGGVGQFEPRFQGKGSSLGNMFWFLQN